MLRTQKNGTRKTFRTLFVPYIHLYLELAAGAKIELEENNLVSMVMKKYSDIQMSQKVS